MSNPYESPQPGPFAGVAGGDLREKLRRVARYQRWVLFALLANFAANILMFATGSQEFIPVRLIVLIIGIGVAIFAIVSIYLLASEVSTPVVGVICGVLMCIPCVSLITLLIINQKATSFLQI
jgi:hypothetical protein